jgi:hypothetical protein
MKTSFESTLFLLCAVLLCASSAFANITNPGAAANMPPAPPVTMNLGAAPEGGTSAASVPIAVVQSFPVESTVLRTADGASLFWLGVLGVLGVSLFGTGAMLIVRSSRVEAIEAAILPARPSRSVTTARATASF